MSLGASIVISTHDRPDSLAKVFESVLAQTLRPGEVIVVHDGPGALPADLGEKARRAGVTFRYERIGRPSLPASRNRGLAVAQGDVVLLMDDDGALPPDYLERLLAMYRADAAGRIAGIGGIMDDPALRRPARRLWLAMAHLLARGPWSPVRCAGRYVRLPRPLAGRLRPARWLSGGAISLRRSAAGERFEERFAGYALFEDREFCLRVGQRRPLLVAPQLRVRHEPHPAGRPDLVGHGRMYVAHWLHIVRHCLGGQVGAWLLFAWDMLGAMLLYATWSAATGRRKNLTFAWGMARELGGRAAGAVRRGLWGRAWTST